MACERGRRRRELLVATSIIKMHRLPSCFLLLPGINPQGMEEEEEEKKEEKKEEEEEA